MKKLSLAVCLLSLLALVGCGQSQQGVSANEITSGIIGGREVKPAEGVAPVTAAAFALFQFFLIN